MNNVILFSVLVYFAYSMYHKYENCDDNVNLYSNHENYEFNYMNTCLIKSKLKYKSINLSNFENEIKPIVLIHGIQEWYDSNHDSIIQDNEKVADSYFVKENQYENIIYDEQYSYDIYVDNVISRLLNITELKLIHKDNECIEEQTIGLYKTIFNYELQISTAFMNSFFGDMISGILTMLYGYIAIFSL